MSTRLKALREAHALTIHPDWSMECGCGLRWLDCDIAWLLSRIPSTEAVRSAVGSVLWHASNYPDAVQARMLGQDTAPLRDKVTEAVMALVKSGEVAGE